MGVHLQTSSGNSSICIGTGRYLRAFVDIAVEEVYRKENFVSIPSVEERLNRKARSN